MSTRFKRVRTPGSSANLGPGFDTLAVALARYIEVSASAASSFEVQATGYGSEVLADESHLGAKVAQRVLGHTKISLSIKSDLPLSRGLGSSAALTLGVAAALGAEDPLAVAIEMEGHPENAAASFLGGAVCAGFIDLKPIVRPLVLDKRLVAVLIVPELEVPTERARAALPAQYDKGDAVFNLQRAVLLANSLGNAALLTPELFEDRLHQKQRCALFPESERIIQLLLDSGAIGACWSGAGSSILAFALRDSAGTIMHQVSSAVSDQLGVSHEASVVEFDRSGLSYLP